jgi:nicotinate-nucleotide pyrophosphorylase (carboxylating)
MLEKYAVLLGGGVNGRFGLDDGVFIKANHAALAGGVGTTVKSTRERIGHLHKIEVEVANDRDVKEALDNGADALSIQAGDVGTVSALVAKAREYASTASIVISGSITIESVRAFAEAGADLIRVDSLTQSVRAMDISFQIQAG